MHLGEAGGRVPVGPGEDGDEAGQDQVVRWGGCPSGDQAQEAADELRVEAALLVGIRRDVEIVFLATSRPDHQFSANANGGCGPLRITRIEARSAARSTAARYAATEPRGTR